MKFQFTCKSAMIGLCCLYGVSASASMEWQTSQGELKLYGDVEFNIDAVSKKGQLTSTKTCNGILFL